MKTSIAAVMLLAAAGLAYAQTPGIKPGLWETKVVKMVNDGKDMSEMMAKMQAQLANLPPDQRAMVESQMKAHGMSGGAGGVIRMCISPAMAAKHQVGGDPHGHCPPAQLQISGNKTTFSINCTYEGNTTVGTGQAVMSGDSITTHVDMKTTGAQGNHTVVADTQMSYIGANCQGLKPLDQK